MFATFLSNLSPIDLLILLIAVITLISGFYIWEKGNKNLITNLLSIILFTYSFNAFTICLSLLPITINFSVLIYRMQWISWIFSLGIFYSVSILIREQQGENLINQKRFLNFILIPLGFILSVIIPFTNIFVEWQQPLQNLQGQVGVWFIYSYSSMVILILLRFLVCGLVIFNAFIFWKKSSHTYHRKRALIIFISGLIGALSLSIGGLLAYLGETISSDFTLSLINLFLVGAFGGTISLVFAITEFNAFIGEGKRLLKDFIATLLSNLFWVFLIAIVFFTITNFSEEHDSFYLLIVLFLSLPIIILNLTHKTKRFLLYIFEKEDSILTISEEDINFVIKNLNSLNHLSKSKLLKLETVKARKRFENKSKEEILAELFKDIILNLKPKNIKNRNKPLLKYEILRMIYEEQALESQLLWDLGFESGSKVNVKTPPRYPVKSNSEYKATSIMSYRRLKKEAFNEVIWKILQLEKNSLRIDI